eukprot:15039494-Heterocapsa_arctica.AAC.1
MLEEGVVDQGTNWEKEKSNSSSKRSHSVRPLIRSKKIKMNELRGEEDEELQVEEQQDEGQDEDLQEEVDDNEQRESRGTK